MKLRCMLLSLLLLAALALPAAGAEAKADIPASALDLAERWEDEGYPDTVGGVWVNEADRALVVAVVDGDQAAIDALADTYLELLDQRNQAQGELNA